MNPVLIRQQKEIFLEELMRTGNVTLAARVAGWRYPTIAEEFRSEDPEFALAWTDAQRQANDALVAEARRRAVEGVQEPVFYKGEIVGSITKHSDKLLELMLKAEMPHKYRDVERTADEQPGVLVVPRSDKALDITDWEKDASAQQQALLARTE